VTLGILFGGLARMIGVFMIFSILGPLAFATMMLGIATWFSTPFLGLMTIFVSPTGIRSIASAAAWVFTVAAALVAIPPSAIAGFIFAMASVGAGANAIWTAWLAAAVAIAAVIVLGLFVVTQESSAVILPKVQTAGQALALFLMFAVVAVPPVALCWWVTKPLHRGSIVG
jgi:hypothetical protein